MMFILYFALGTLSISSEMISPVMLHSSIMVFRMSMVEMESESTIFKILSFKDILVRWSSITSFTAFAERLENSLM